MSEIKYKIELFDFWHTSSGLSGGMDVDLTVLKDEHGLPVLPGKTIKGLLREAAESIHVLNEKLVSKEFIDYVFGERSDLEDEARNDYKEAEVFFSDATLSQNVINNTSKFPKDLFYREIASTEIDKNGQAKEHSLRQMEVTIPLELYGTLLNMDDKYIDELKWAFSWIKRLGYNRNRGLGRCKISIKNQE